MKNPDPTRLLRILILWGNQHVPTILEPAFLLNPKYEFEIVSGGEEGAPSPHQAGPLRLWKLRKRLENNEFDLVISGTAVHVPWPRFKRPVTQFIKAIRSFTTSRIRLLDTFWTPFLLSGKLRGKIPLAVVDQLDQSFIVSWDLPLLKACNLFFKVNLFHLPLNSLQPLATIYGHSRIFPLVTKLRPLSLGIDRRFIPQTVRPMQERDIDILCTGTIRRPPAPGKTVDPLDPYNCNFVRQDIHERCAKLGNKYRVHCVDQPVSPEDYVRLLHRSKLVVCTESVGCETGRIYDVAAHAAVPLINWPYTQNYKMLEPDIHAIYFSLIGNDFETVVEKALADPERLQQIAEAARAFTIKHKDRAVIGDYVVSETLREFAAQRELDPEVAVASP